MHFAANEYLLLMKKEGIYINPDHLIRYSETNLPNNLFNFKSHLEIYWKVKDIGYNAAVRHISLEVIDYSAQYDHAFVFQEFEREFNLLIFEPLDWGQFEPQLQSFVKARLLPFLKPESMKGNTFVAYPEARLYQNIVSEPTVHQWKPFSIQVSVAIPNLTFSSGHISCEALVMGKMVPLTIHNAFLKSEFDLIKKWFVKKFKSDVIIVTVTGEYCQGEFRNIVAASEHIAAINQEFIQEFQALYIDELLLKLPENPTRKFIRVAELNTEDELANAIFTEGVTPDALLQQIINLKGVRNQNELEYLCSHPNVEAGKIIFTNPPQPGFIFSFTNGSEHRLIWELLDSNATYIWIFPGSILDTEIEGILNRDLSVIDVNGRQQFRRHIKEKNKEYIFRPINHKIEANGGFDVGKQKLKI